MQMGTEAAWLARGSSAGWSRRHWVGMAAALVSGAPWWSALAAVSPTAPQRLLAAWQRGSDHGLGVVALRASAPPSWRVQHALELPTRAHGLWAEPAGSVLAVARRPGDWLVRWHPVSGLTQWHWVEDDRRFNGHVWVNEARAVFWTTETDQADAQGLLALRNLRSLEKIDEWPTSGMDPHQLLALPEPLGEWPAGTLMVANGGIATWAESGRSKLNTSRIDASLVAIHPRSGELLGQWRLDDPFLSIRHLAWCPVGRTLGAALQAEHSNPLAVAQAPVLAVWDGKRLSTAADQPALQGYGGDICARPGGGFVVSCPRAHAVALFDAQGGWVGRHTIVGAYALAAGQEHWVVSGQPDVWIGPDQSLSASDLGDRPKWSWDNHWSILRAAV